MSVKKKVTVPAGGLGMRDDVERPVVVPVSHRLCLSGLQQLLPAGGKSGDDPGFVGIDPCRQRNGVLDRLDSLTYTAPLFFHYLYYLYY